MPIKLRPLYLAGMSVMFSFAAIVAPLVGAGLTERVGWKWCFWINLPVGVPVMGIMGFFFRPPSRVGGRCASRKGFCLEED